jgi:uncharacterized membrane protein (DUF485 family)
VNYSYETSILLIRYFDFILYIAFSKDFMMKSYIYVCYNLPIKNLT